MESIVGKSGTIVVILGVVVLIGVLFMPQIKQWMLNLRGAMYAHPVRSQNRAGHLEGRRRGPATETARP